MKKTEKILLITITAIMLSVSLPARAEIKLITPLPGQSGATQSVSGLADYLVKIYNLGLIVAGVLALAGLVFGGFLYMTSSYSGNVVKTADGLDIVKSSLLGLAIALLSYLLMYTLDPKLTRPKDAFFNIPEGTCNGGIPNVEDQSICDSYCYAYVDGKQAKEEDQIYTASYDLGTKCCRCIEKKSPSIIKCAESESMQISLSECASICVSKCPAGKTCGPSNQAVEGCCRCEQSDTFVGESSIAPQPIETEAAPANEAQCINACTQFCTERGQILDSNVTNFNSGSCTCACIETLTP